MRPGFHDAGEGAGTEEEAIVRGLRCGSAVAALLDPAVAEVELSLRPLLREKEIEADGLGAELAAAVEDPDGDLHQVAPPADDRGLQVDVLVGGMGSACGSAPPCGK